jgi:hypothetical protein
MNNMEMAFVNGKIQGRTEGKKQGAVEELDIIKFRIDELWRNEKLDFETASRIKLIIYNRKKELKEGVEK